MSSPLKIPVNETFKLSLRQRHLEQLRNVHVPAHKLPRIPEKGTNYDNLVKWSGQAKDQIAKAIAAQAVGPVEDIDWNIGLFALLESAATYLRDDQKVAEAVLEARKNTTEGNDKALLLLKESQDEIVKIAALWGLHFEVICDLLGEGPLGEPQFDGPFCGVFWSDSQEKPFLGLAFKGTNTSDWQEIFTDLDAGLRQALGGRLWGSYVHAGFYDTLFSVYDTIDRLPFDYIKLMIDDFLQGEIVPSGVKTYLHSTGHSLGAAYALLWYSEFLRIYNNLPGAPAPQGADAAESEPEQEPETSPAPARPVRETALSITNSTTAYIASLKEKRQFILRDLYTFGCPRSGGVKSKLDWAQSFTDAMEYHNGRSWRIVNNWDPVTRVPPAIPIFGGTWNHVDSGMQLLSGEKPEIIPTEVGTKPGFDANPLRVTEHYTTSYFPKVFFAATGKNPPN